MKVRTRITILFTLITASILFFFACVIYYSAKKNREQEFYALLEKEAITKANLFFNAQVESRTLQNIYRNNRQIINEVEVAIYNRDFQLLYHDDVIIDFVKETKSMIDEVYLNGDIRFYQEDWQVVGMLFDFEGSEYIITATAYDESGYNKLNSLLQNSVLVFIIAILFICIAGFFFSKKAFDPVKELTQKAKLISATNLDLRLTTNGNKDELTEMANTFNEMLERLERSFDAQKHFVSNVSHELRTPLAAIIAELELAVSRERNLQECKLVLQNVLSDSRKIVRLTNNLLDLAKASYDPSEISFRPLRIDEILLDARQQVEQAYPAYRIAIQVEEDFEDDSQIMVNANEYLLKVAFGNLIENGCKYSNEKKITVIMSFAKEHCVLRFVDQGIGIADEDIPNLFSPFFRGENSHFSEGLGIGLSLTQKIVALHQGLITVASKKNMGTTITVQLPKMSPVL
ncbi:HAMP domain-containing histidine kinase [Algoriphagus sp. AGSA1]|uniref:sensor histidine kinase n=1 Tax=Algoriphagus sp. AGSA1 TaxID=2907213 RepID=UPI001F19D0E5|nr:HAMP domain-containing sensor histidine kinase [Algoriphagus sp. AGSA1]MCE7055496.1 HAMP domain-containing histidine kinase [Algoriphagus sp. AGSA1]